MLLDTELLIGISVAGITITVALVVIVNLLVDRSRNEKKKVSHED